MTERELIQALADTLYKATLNAMVFFDEGGAEYRKVLTSALSLTAKANDYLDRWGDDEQ